MKSSVKIILSYLIALFCFTSSICSVEAQEIKFNTLSVEDGLSNSYVNCLLQDHFGFLWFGTDDGLNRYDGFEMKVYRNRQDDDSSLSDNIIWSLFEDRSGYLWVGTKTGKLNRYDPYNDRFEHWSLPSDENEEMNITFITQDKNNFIWIGTYKNGLYRFDLSHNKFDHWQNKIKRQKILSNNYILSVLEDDSENIWIGTFSGLDKFNPGNSEKPFLQIFKASENSNVFQNVPIWHLSKSSFFKESILIGSLNGLAKFSPSVNEYSPIALPESLDLQFGNSVSSVVEEELNGEKIFWIGTYGGLVRYNLTAGTKERFIQSKKNPSGLLSNEIHDLIIDKSGVVWIATDNGLNFYSPKRSKFNFQLSRNYKLEKFPNLLNKNIRAIAQTNSKLLWVGTEGGLFGVQSIKRIPSLFYTPELQTLNIWALFSGNSDNLWIGTYGQGLKELDLKSKKLKSWRIKNNNFNTSAYNYVKTILQDDKGLVWVGFWGGGLARLNPVNTKIEYWRNENNNPSSLSFNDVWILYQDRKGRIWVGTNGGGLNLFAGDAGNGFYHWKANKNDGPGLSSNNLYTICEAVNGNVSPDQTILWIGTSNGLNKLIVKNDYSLLSGDKPIVEIKYYTVNDGLPDNAVESILEDNYGNLWIGTSSGISFFNAGQETFTNFSLADGLNGNSFNSSSALKTKEGFMFFGSTTGLNYFNPEKIKESNYLPPVIITDFQILNQPINESDKTRIKMNLFTRNKIILSYSQNDFSFQFASLDYNAPEINKYAYMLEGFDKEWIYCGTRRFVTYTNLDPGEYVLHVKGTNSDGKWNETGTSITLIITPPFWMTWWAYSAYALILLLTLFFIRMVEINRRKKKEEERLIRERESALLREAKLRAITIEQEKELEKQKIRNRIAQDLHDEIGSNLSSISLMSELIQKDGKINHDAFEKIQRIQKVAKSSTQAMRDIVWLTNPESDNIKDLVSKMNEVANDLLGRIKWNFDFPEKLNELILVPETKRNVFLIYKEALNNIVKHSGAKFVIINLKTMNDRLTLEISDDGKGFNPNVGSTGNGLKNMRNRAKEIRGKLELKSNSGKGTKLILEVNITQVRD